MKVSRQQKSKVAVPCPRLRIKSRGGAVALEYAPLQGVVLSPGNTTMDVGRQIDMVEQDWELYDGRLILEND